VGVNRDGVTIAFPATVGGLRMGYLGMIYMPNPAPAAMRHRFNVRRAPPSRYRSGAGGSRAAPQPMTIRAERVRRNWDGLRKPVRPDDPLDGDAFRDW
jgi:hypothetical protein